MDLISGKVSILNISTNFEQYSANKGPFSYNFSVFLTVILSNIFYLASLIYDKNSFLKFLSFASDKTYKSFSDSHGRTII